MSAARDIRLLRCTASQERGNRSKIAERQIMIY